MSMIDSLSGSQVGVGEGQEQLSPHGLQFPEEGQAAEQKEGAPSHGEAQAEQGLLPQPGPGPAPRVSWPSPTESDSSGFRGVQASDSSVTVERSQVKAPFCCPWSPSPMTGHGQSPQGKCRVEPRRDSPLKGG